MKFYVNKLLNKIGIHISRALPIPDTQPLLEHFPGVSFIGPVQNYVIGDRVTIGVGSILFACEPITIGDNAMIAVGTIIHTSTHDFDSHPMWKYRIDRPVYIGRYSWIGAGAVILPGIRVGDNAVVGAGSVVTASVPDGAIVAGNPARILKYRNKADYQKKPDIIEFEDAIVKKESFISHEIKRKR